MSWTLLQNSLVVAGCTAVFGGALGFLFGLCAAALPKSLRRVAIVCAIAVFVLPPFLVSNTWLNYFGLNGTWQRYLKVDLYSLPGTVLLLTLELWPIAFLVVLGSLLKIDRTYLEQETLLHGTTLLRYLVWPNCRSALSCGLPLIFVLALNNFTVPSLLQTKVFAAEVWLSFMTKFDYGEALRMSWPLIVTPLVLIALLRTKPTRFLARSADFPEQLWRERMGFLFPLVGLISVTLIFFSLVLPLAQLCASPRTWTEFIPAIRAGQPALMNSVLFAFLSAVLVMALGALLSRVRAGAVGWLFFLTPGVFIGIALIRIFNRPGLSWFYQGIGIVLLAFAVRYFAIGWAAVRAGAGETDRAAMDVVVTLGATRWQQFRLAEWPQGKGLFFAGFYFVYLLCLWEVETLILIVPPGRETLAVRIFNMLHYGHAGQVDALCLWMLLLGVAPLVAFGGARLLASLVPHRVKRLGRSLAPSCLGLLLIGCGSGNPADSTKLKSKLFSSVQVFGTRGTGAGQFNKPRSVAIDREDNFYVVDMTGRVQKFSPDGKFILSWQMPQTQKGNPKGMGRDINGNIIVVEPHYSRVNHFTPEGKLVAQWGANGTNQGQLYFPRSVAINSRGEMYLTEYGMVERINRFSQFGTNFIQAIGRPGTGPGELNRAEGVGIAPDDTVFEADSCNHRVQIFTPEGKLITTFGSPGSGPNEMSYPYDVQIDSLGYRYVCEFGNSRVQIFDAQNHFFEMLGEAGAEPGQMNNPWAIALDSRGNLYVADSLYHRVQKFIRRNPLTPAGNHTQAPRPTPSVAAK